MSHEQHELVRRARRINLSVETLTAIEDAVAEDSNSTFVDGARFKGCPVGQECPPDIIRSRIAQAVALYCAGLIAESQK
jgi:hypothetical protein